MAWGPGVSDALKDGTLDGLIVNIDSGYDINAHKPAPNILVSQKLWLGHEYIIALNKSIWDNLAKADKDAIERAAESSYSVLGEIMNTSFTRQIEILRADGAEVRIMNDDEVSFWENSTDYENVQDKWISDDVQAAEALKKLRELIGNSNKPSCSVKSGISFSKQWGLYIANVIEKDGAVSNVIIDRLANGKSSKELHDNYGIKPVSTLNKDWWEQVAYYEEWVLKNGIEAVKYDKSGKAENVDLISGATIGIDDLTLAVLDALNK